MENQMDKKMENEMETWVLCGFIYSKPDSKPQSAKCKTQPGEALGLILALWILT